jgi:outer membrane biosynthesis protein TonB
MAENETKVGEVTHFFPGPSAAVLRLSAALKLGDQIHIVGFTTDLVENVNSMQIDHNSVQSANPGDDVAILVKDRVREGDEVFVVAPGTTVQPRQVSMTPAPASAMTAPSAMVAAAPKPAAPKPVAALKPAAAAEPKPKVKPKVKAKPKAKPKVKAKPKKKAKPKAKAKSKPKGKAKPKKKSRR